jgi:hypothetical protein
MVIPSVPTSVRFPVVPLDAAVISPFPLTVKDPTVNEPTFEFTVARVEALLPADIDMSPVIADLEATTAPDVGESISVPSAFDTDVTLPEGRL